MNIDRDSDYRKIPIVRILPGAGRTELTCLEVICGLDPEEPSTIHQFQVDESSSFGIIIENTGLNRLEIQRIERWGQPEAEADEIDYTVMPLNPIHSLQGKYALLDQNGTRRLDCLVSVCLDD